MALIALCLWVVAAWIAMVATTPRQSWSAAIVLVAAGAPIVVWLGFASVWWAALGAATMALVLRWPLLLAARWLGGRLG